MSIIRISTRYAKALLDQAVESKELDTVYNDLNSFKQHMEDNRDLENLVESPIVSAEIKLASLTEIYSTKLSALTMDFIKLTIVKGREVHLNAIINQFIKEYNTFNGRVSGKLITAVAISDGLKDKIVASVKKQINKDVIVEPVVDASLIGGYIFELEDQLIDASVKYQLSKISHIFSK